MSRFGGDLTEEQQTKLREQMDKLRAGRNIRDLSPEEQQKFREEMAKIFQSVTGRQAPAFGQRQRGEGGQAGQAGASEGGPRVMTFQRPGGAEGAGQGGAMPGGMPVMMPSFGQQFSDAELEKAKLPPAPEEDNSLDVLLRPGLLADVEIIVEKVPNAIHIPVQAVFEKEGKLLVYVKNGNRFDERLIKPLKRSESVMVIADGLKPGEMVALTDPAARKSDKKAAEKGKAAMPSPGAPAGGGR
jgi:hypothetical protein